MSEALQKQIQIQRLVDGQLSRQQTQLLLREAEGQHELYREIALAYVEDQMWGREICRAGNDSHAAAPVSSHVAHLPSSGMYGSRNGSTWLQWAAVASLLCAVGLGYWAGGMGRDGVGSFGGSDGNSTSGLRVADGQGPWNAAPYQAQFVDRSGRTLTDQQIPLYPETYAREMGYRMQPQPVPQKVQSEFHRVGYELQPETVLMSGRTSDGREVVFPMQNVKIRSYGQ